MVLLNVMSIKPRGWLFYRTIADTVNVGATKIYLLTTADTINGNADTTLRERDIFLIDRGADTNRRPRPADETLWQRSPSMLNQRKIMNKYEEKERKIPDARNNVRKRTRPIAISRVLTLKNRLTFRLCIG